MSESPMGQTPPGYYTDPNGKERWWDGTSWGEVRPGGPGVEAAPVGAPVKKGTPWGKIALGVVLAGILGLVGCVGLLAVAVDQGAEEVDRRQAAATEEVKLDTCAAVEFLGAKATGTAGNGSSERSDYWVEVTFLAADGTVLDTGYGNVQNVQPGGVGQWEAPAFADGVSGVSSCEVVNVTRTASM